MNVIQSERVHRIATRRACCSPVRMTLRVVRSARWSTWLAWIEVERVVRLAGVARCGAAARDRSLLGCSGSIVGRLLGIDRWSAARDRSTLRSTPPPPTPLRGSRLTHPQKFHNEPTLKTYHPVAVDPIPTAIDPHAPHVARTAKTPPPSQEMGFWLWQYLKFFGR